MNAASTPEGISGAELREVLRQAGLHLRMNRAALNAINVYPVPDGDTGSNMTATFDEAVAGALELPDEATASDVLRAVARAALFGARGNSGVILSQALGGFSEGADGAENLSGAVFAEALERAATRAYGAVAVPREGTMLTVLRAAAEDAKGVTESLLDAVEGAVRGAEAAEAATIDQLPQLKEAGVTDSGGEGVCVILRGMLAALKGEAPPDVETTVDASSVRAFAEAHSGEEYGYCVEFIVSNENTDVDIERLRSGLDAAGATSIVVVAAKDLARVHVHTLDERAPVEIGKQFGTVGRLKVDNMSKQAAGTPAAQAPGVGVLALSTGHGFDRAFREFGARTMDLGDYMKPSAGDIARTADAIGSKDVIVLPNHENVLFAAKQAQELTQCALHVVPTTTMPQGLAAMVAYEPDASVDELVEAMEESRSDIVTVEVTQATADRTADGVAVAAGEYIALVDGKLVASKATSLDAMLTAARSSLPESASLATVFIGSESEMGEGDIRPAFEDALPGIELEFVDGGQPLYLFILSIE